MGIGTVVVPGEEVLQHRREQVDLENASSVWMEEGMIGLVGFEVCRSLWI